MNESMPLHGGQLEQLAERFGLSASDLLDFSANINPEGPPASVLSSLRASLEDLATLSSYPDIHESALRESIASSIGVSPRNVAVANGFVPLLEAALRVLPIRRCLLPVPAFVEYRRVLARAQVEITPCILNPECDFNYEFGAYDLGADDLGPLIGGEQDAVLLANPQNPTGVICDRDTLISFATRALAHNICILLDEAFIDYLPEHSLVPYMDSLPNLIVFRSVTKFYGVPGLRVAYAVASPEVVASLQENLPPWAITTLASRAVSALLKDETYPDRMRLLNSQRRDLLRIKLEALGLHVYPSGANFLLFRLPCGVDADAFWERMIVEHHIVLRSCTNYEGLRAGYLRAAVRNDEDNSRLVRAVALRFSQCC